MPRIIVKCRYIKSAPVHRANLVDYIATREGVDKDTGAGADHPATPKQEELISELLRTAPDTRDMFEYEDYIANPTVSTASEFITQALEQNADRFADREVFLEYIANRPRVQKMGTHGLFGDDGAVVNLVEVQREVAAHPGNVWTNIVSLRREDAARLGYDSAAAWQGLMRERQYDIAEQMKIQKDNLRWYAAYHDEGSHPHIHFIAYSTDPKEAFLTKQGIDGIRSCLAREIFRQDLQQIYSEQTMRRDALNHESLSVMREYVQGIYNSLQMQNGVCGNPQITAQLQLLSDRLSKTGGKKVYGYLKADTKAIVDGIVDELSKDTRVAACYEAWYEMRNQVLQTYADKLPAPLPLSQQKEFKQIKNMVIAEAVRLGGYDFHAIQNDEPDYCDERMPEPAPLFLDAPDDDVQYCVDWSDEYKLARSFLFGSKTQAPDFDTAHALLLMEANGGNALAMHDLGRMYADGLGRDVDAEAARQWYAKALAGFLAVEDIKVSRYVEYRIGKMYAAGLGTEQDYTQAADWFAEAVEKNHKYAQYSLGSLYYCGQGVQQDYIKAFSLYKKSAAQGNAYASYELAKMLRDGVGCEQDTEQSGLCFEEAFDGFKGMEAERSDDKLQYRLGQMLRDGVGTEPDAQQAQLYFEASSRLGNPHAQYALAKMMMETGDAGQIAGAVEWLSKSADSGNQFAQYSLGKLYRNGEHIERDLPRAVELLTRSAEQDNQYAGYALGKLLLTGEDVPKDVPAAVHWLTQSAEQNNQFAQYALGRLYLEGGDTGKDVQAAVRWLTESAEQNNQFAQYQLGKLYLLGRDIERDRDQAVYWFTLSAVQGNEYAQFFLVNIDNPNPSLEHAATQLIRKLARQFENQQQNLSALANHIDRKRARELREKRIAQGHARDEQIQNY